eukprot:6890507-Pyramimonas_sp.AAC.1
MPLLLAPSFISSVEGVLCPGEAHFALALAPVLVSGSGLRPRRRAGAFTRLTLTFLPEVYAAVLEDQDILDLVEGCRMSRGCPRHQVLRRREACMVQEEGSKRIAAHRNLRI